MVQASAIPPPRPFIVWKKDLGVAIVLVIALLLGLLLRQVVVSRTKVFQDAQSPFRMEYPAGWVTAESLQEVLLKVEDPTANSVYKTTLTVEARDLDPSSPPTLQTLVDRRVQTSSELPGYHFISNDPATVGGAQGQQLRYAYITEPIDAPRRLSLPVVVIARDYIVTTKDRTYYITLTAPENEFDKASARLDSLIQTVKVE